MYLTDIPESAADYGLCKTLTVRREIIHIKHILTEIFVRKTINLGYISNLGMDLYQYMEYMSNRIRHVHKFSRRYKAPINEIVKKDRDKFFPTIELYKGLNVCIVLDFDGVVTKGKFHYLYKLCCERSKVHICSANPNVTEDWFVKRDLPLPYKIHSMKGKYKKIKRLLEIQKMHDYVFYVDNESIYLEYAWIFGLQTYIWTNKIKYFTLKTK
jgi:hypothetical protein